MSRFPLSRRLLASVGLLFFAQPLAAAERELEEAPPPSSADEIETPIERVFPDLEKKPSLFPWVREQLEGRHPFLADTRLEARFRTYYLRKHQTTDVLSEAWAMGGSLYYRSGWLADMFAIEVEGFTSQPLYAPEDRGGTGLLAPVQEGYSALGIANAKLRYKGIELTGFRQYLDLPYVNRNDSRMTPNTFESVTLTKSEGGVLFSTGYTWKIKRRTSDEFVSMSEAIGFEKERGFVHGGIIWDPSEDLHVGATTGVMPDVFGGTYGELGFVRPITDQLQARIDTQFTYQYAIAKELPGVSLADTWNLGIRSSSSWKGAMLRLGATFTGPNGPILHPYGSSPSYSFLMQRAFDRAREKALLASLSYDFSRLGIDGLSFIMNFAAGFGGEESGERGNAQEVDLTLDYRLGDGLLESFWLRLRGSWLHDELADRDGTDVRAILRYDFQVI